MSNFTEGTWWLEDKNRQICCDTKLIANVSSECVPDYEAESNARLIVYAPEMYKMLCRVLDEVDEIGNTDIEGDIMYLLKDING